MTPRQCEIAAESYAASLLARAGYDILVQYGANQPNYDLVAEKDGVFLPISVKGSQDGGWMLAVKHKTSDRTYHEAADAWLAAQRKDIVFIFVQFLRVNFDAPPRVYVARPAEIAAHLKTQRAGQGYGSLQEGVLNIGQSKYNHRIPESWCFSSARLKHVSEALRLGNAKNKVSSHAKRPALV